MPRANRYYIPGCVWHITHRCHKKEFLLKFEKDWLRWSCCQKSTVDCRENWPRYNRRKDRKGAFWEDRYHATAVEQGEHLAQCLVYIDLNMVRAGVVKHPEEYRHSAFVEIMSPPKRYAVIDDKTLMNQFGITDLAKYQQMHQE